MDWLAVNILLPLLAPLCASLFFYALYLPRATKRRLNPLLAIKDGQLCWVAVCFCASALHEQAALGLPMNWLSGALILVLVLSSLLAASGALFHTPVVRRPHCGWGVHYRNLVGSVLLALTAAALFILVHT